MVIRDAVRADMDRVAAIYNQGIEDRIATFETDVRTGEEVAAWLETRLPVLVTEIDGEVVGYAVGISYSGRCAYSGVIEFSFYVARESRGRGIGSALLREFLAVARARGYHKVVGNLLAKNLVSTSTMLKCGFREVGVFERHGQLDGEWHDVRVMECLL